MVASTPDGSLAVTVLLKCGWAIAAVAVSSVSVTVAVMALVIACPPVPPAESIAATQPRWWPQAGEPWVRAPIRRVYITRTEEATDGAASGEARPPAVEGAGRPGRGRDARGGRGIACMLGEA